ncbi:protein ALTERED XYLOGLUCAN 4-like [Salvia divinorum]|uniref:Protein ALTERED XYLOGLUCAN 4-like n=1 Tax=Salvia divinorum TaxID=28513 RepID=A0ABD1G603_SALDI
MKSESNYKVKHHFLVTTTSLFFFITFIAIITIFSHHLIYYRTDIKYTNNTLPSFNQTVTVQPKKEIETCDLFKGQWIPGAPLYTNYSCTTIPIMKNCLLQGRKDTDFLYWRWKPDKCEIPRFSAPTFLKILRGKKMAFIGDSLARNHMESLLCLLATGETPTLIEKDEDDKFTTWEFPKHNFTLTALWSPFLVTATKIVVNGTETGGFHLHLDRPDPKWLEKLPSMDYAVFNGGHWYFRQNSLYEGGNIMGCVYCPDPNVTHFGPGLAIGRSFRTAFKAINECKKCKRIVTFVRTFSPQHFENGEWNTGGDCNRSRLIGPDEVDRARPDWEYRDIQVKEAEAARDAGRERGNVFDVIDVTEMMQTRVDGHPGVYWRNKWMKGFNDCLHWCMPGPADTWNELLLETIKRQNRISS